MRCSFYLSLVSVLLLLIGSTQQQTSPPEENACLKSLRPAQLDATGQLPSGLLKGNFDLQGDFDECYEADGLYTFALGTFKIVPVLFSPLLQNISGIPFFLRWGICLPESCDLGDFIASGGLQALSLAKSGGAYYFTSIGSVQVTENPDPPLTTAAICFIVFCATLIFFLIVGTGYDYFFAQMNESYFATVPQLNPDENEKERILMRAKSYEELQEIDELSPGQTIPFQDRSGAHLFCHEALLAFSMIRNFNDFAQIKVRDVRTAALDGIRLFAILWVVLGHCYLFLMWTGVTNLFDVRAMKERFLFQFVANGTFSVDVFFVLSGFLMTFLMFKSLTKENGRLKWGLLYFHRYWRLSPLYYFTIFYVVSIFDYMLDGPIAGLIPISNPCRTQSWANIIYLNNFLPEPMNNCVNWTWYLALDMQFFVVAVPIIYILFHKAAFGVAVLSSLCIAGYIATGVLVGVKGYNIGDFLLNMNMNSNDDTGSDGVSDSNYYKDLYISPWARFQVYGIGIALGYFCFNFQREFKLNWISQVLAMLGSFVVLAAPIYATYWGYGENEWSLAGNIFYLTFARTIFALGLSGVIFLCFTGNGGFINWFFSWGIFQVLSKLTYAVYLFHIIVMAIYFVSFRHLPYFDDTSTIMYYFAISVMTFVIAFALHLTFELPFAKLEKAFLTPFSRAPAS
mmetsp:Transcript_408/g.611  ORF Transcript_408/g.611 Transcript_408/m.611 type:complete len:682 (-) Transcript_408:100-2145(-)